MKKFAALMFACMMVVFLSVLPAQNVEAHTADIITFESLLDKMVDLEWLANAPIEGERGAQFSSYDRASQIVFGIKVQWYANEDAGHFHDTIFRNGRREEVLAEMEGPGSIVRIWSANPEGILRIYLDHSTDPVIQMPLKNALNGLGGLPFSEPFSGIRAGGGANLYFPIPYQSHALVTVENPGRLYYHVNYIEFSDDTVVESYSPELITTHRDKILHVGSILEDPYSTVNLSDSTRLSVDVELGPGESHVVHIDGPAAVTELLFKLTADGDLDQALRDTLLLAKWDNREKSGIWSPIGDFFGGSPGLNPFESLPLGILRDGTMYSRWYMPFEASGTIELLNEGEQTVQISGSIAHKPIEWADNTSYFNAKWRKNSYLVGHHDWHILSAEGPGRFVGLTLSLMNPVRAWWGEGDEKVYVDGEQFPSTFGTGTEDYFGYAWSSPDLFFHAYHNQTRADGPDNFGRVINNRFHFLDNIPFHEHIRFDMEVWHWVQNAAMSYSAVAYWYSQADADGFVPVAVDRRKITYPPAPTWLEVEGAIEGEHLRIISVSRGIAETQGMDFFATADRQWSYDGHLWWREGQIGDTLKLAIPVEKSGNYTLSAVFTKARDYGIFKLSVGEGRFAFETEVDLFDPAVIPTEEMELGEVYFEAGDNILTVEIIGNNPSSVGYMFGLDYLKLTPVD